MSCGVGRRCGSDLELLWLWCKLAATAPVQPLAWEPPYAAGAAQEIATTTTTKKKKKEKKRNFIRNKKVNLFIKKKTQSSCHGTVVNESNYEP